MKRRDFLLGEDDGSGSTDKHTPAGRYTTATPSSPTLSCRGKCDELGGCSAAESSEGNGECVSKEKGNCYPGAAGLAEVESPGTTRQRAVLDVARGDFSAAADGRLPLVPQGVRMADDLVHFLLGNHPLFRWVKPSCSASPTL